MCALDKPLRSEHTPEERQRQAKKRGESPVRSVRCCLTRMGEHRRAFADRVPPDIDPVGDLGPGRVRPLERSLIEFRREPVDLGGNVDRADEQVPVDRRFQHGRCSGEFGGAKPDLVHLNVVGVPVAARGVVDREYVRVLFSQDRGQFLRGDVRVDSGERPPARVRPAGRDGCRSIEARVGVSEQLGPGAPESGCGTPQLGEPPRLERLVVTQEVGGDQPDPATRCCYQYHPMALGGRAGHRARGQQRLVVRMGVKGHQRERHGCHLGPSPADTVSWTTFESCGERVKIVHLTDCYLPRLGGIEMQVRDLAARQQQAGHQVHVVTTTPASARDERRATSGTDSAASDSTGVRIHRLAMDLPYELPVNPRAFSRLRKVLAAEDFDVAHVHAGVVSPFAFGAAPTAARAGVPTVITLHCLWGYLTPAFRLLDGRGHWSRWPVVLSAVSDVAAVPLRRIVGSEVDVEVLPNGIEPGDWKVDPLPRHPDDVLIVSVMRLAPRKRPMQLLRTLREARELVPRRVRMRARLIGAGPERRSLERYLHRTGMSDWVELTGRLSREQIRETYRRADVFVAPANLESFGIAALEARCAGVPVLAKANSGIREFVADEREGLLAATDGELVGGLVRLCRSPELRQRIAAHNRVTPPPTTWDDVLGRTEKVYARAAELMGIRTLEA